MKKIIAVMMVILTVMSLTIMAQAEAMKIDFAKSVVKSNVNGAVQVDTELQEKADAAFGKGLSIQIAQIEVNGISTGTIKYKAAKAEERSWFGKVLDFVTFWD